MLDTTRMHNKMSKQLLSFQCHGELLGRTVMKILRVKQSILWHFNICKFKAIYEILLCVWLLCVEHITQKSNSNLLASH